MVILYIYKIISNTLTMWCVYYILLTVIAGIILWGIVLQMSALFVLFSGLKRCKWNVRLLCSKHSIEFDITLKHIFPPDISSTHLYHSCILYRMLCPMHHNTFNSSSGSLCEKGIILGDWAWGWVFFMRACSQCTTWFKFTSCYFHWMWPSDICGPLTSESDQISFIMLYIKFDNNWFCMYCYIM